MDLPSEPVPSIAFGRFRVLPRRREVLADRHPINLGGRAFDVLMALIEARGVVSKGALMRRVWPDRVVDENTLQVQISALRAALGPERELIRTVSGRGYQFAGEIRLLSASPDERAGMGVAAAAPNAVQALDWARRQGALSLELRAATSLARLLRDEVRCAEAKALLRPVYDRFTEGFDTADLKAAGELLDELGI
jgi:DNA-binding winged helix-turn-helix (wHTH) protein